MTHDILGEVLVERQKQNAKWGEQNHPNGTGPGLAEAANASRDVCKFAFAQKRGAWRYILDEEVKEAFAEEDPEELKAELIQVAAVAVAWIEAIDRRRG